MRSILMLALLVGISPSVMGAPVVQLEAAVVKPAPAGWKLTKVTKKGICPPSVASTTTWEKVTGDLSHVHLHGIYNIPAPGKHAFKNIVIDSTQAPPANPKPGDNEDTRGSLHCYYDGAESNYWYALMGLYSCTAAGNSITCLQLDR